MENTQLQIRGGIDDNSMKFLFLNENVCCDPSLKPSQRDSSNWGSQTMFFMEKYGKLSLNHPFYPFLSGALGILMKLVFISIIREVT